MNNSGIFVQEKVNMRTVQNLLDNKQIVDNTIDPSTMVIDALKKMISVNLSYLIVKDNDEYKGIFCERDYTRKLVLEGRSSRETMVKDVMTVNLPRVALENTVEECMFKVNKQGSRYLAAFDNHTFAGIITINDLLREVLANKSDVFNNALTASLLDTDEHGKIF